MKVYELMEILSECNQEAEVYICYPMDDGYETIRLVFDVAPYQTRERNLATRIEIV